MINGDLIAVAAVIFVIYEAYKDFVRMRRRKAINAKIRLARKARGFKYVG